MDQPVDGDRARARAEDTALVVAARGGDADAFGALYERWFDRVYDLAFRLTRTEAAAGDVAQDAFLSAWRALGDLEQPDSFGGWLLRITRNRAFKDGRSSARAHPVDAETMAMIERSTAEDRIDALDEPAQLASDAEIAALVWESVDALGARDAEVLDLSLRHGLTPAELAEVIGTNRNAANQMVHRARMRLRDAIAARALWRGGEPACGDLADELRDAGIVRFAAEAVRVATRHAESCEVCSTRRRLRLDPAALFASVPMIGAPVLLKQKVAHALSTEGVPMGDVGSRQPVDDGGPRNRRRIRRWVAAGVAAVVIVGGSVVVASGSLDEAAPHRAALDLVPVPSTSAIVGSTVPPSTPLSTPSSMPVVAPSSTAAPDVAPPPVTEPPAAPPSASPPVHVSISARPSSAPVTYLRPSAPMLTWSTDGPAATVEVSGPNFVSAASNGSTPVCPTASTPMWSVCVGAPGAVTYTVTARAADGAILATASAILTIA